MPNWCTGTMRIRGDKENIKKFLKEAILPSAGKEKDPPICKEVNDYWVTVENTGMAYIKDTRRMFVEDNEIDYYLEDNICYFEISQAWCLEPDDFVKISKTYNIDVKAICFERGMQFAEGIEMRPSWKAPKHEVKNYKDWYWDCPCPTLGG